MAERLPPSKIVLEIPSRLEWLDLVDRMATGIAEQMAFSEEDANSVANSVLEAATNAIQHGHQYNPAHPVGIVFEVAPDVLRVKVHDKGPGFDVGKVLNANPTGPESLLEPRGRGIFIMKSLMDEVVFEMEAGKGCTAVLTKHHPARRAAL
ncbi:MAG: ATP-binding protein [Candidatus Eisenbacteria sp.]|nr:ATP-binding protein [Candidatus Eisenbacteria bacterium]